MITYVVGDLFSSPAQVLVNTVNTVGVMGKGIAYTFKRVYPDMFEEYKHHCDNKSLKVGKLHLFKSPQKWILNFPTKKHWRAKSKIEYIEAGLENFTSTFIDKGIESISFPMLGCQLGGLDWNEVRPVMERHLDRISKEISVYIHLYRPDMVPFPDYRDVAELKCRINGIREYESFQSVWSNLDTETSLCFEWTDALGIAATASKPTDEIFFDCQFEKFTVGRVQLERLWKQLQMGQYCNAALIFDEIQPLQVMSIDIRSLPKLQKPGGYVVVIREESGFYRIGRTIDPARYCRSLSSDRIVEVVPAEDLALAVRELRTRFALWRVDPSLADGTQNLFDLTNLHVAEIKSLALEQQTHRVTRAVTCLLLELPAVKPILISEEPDPSYRDLGLQLIPTQIKNSVVQLEMPI
ncbi:MAG: macro domain-containing protein [Chloroflexota bacterium]|nr:macro domain-containing protein [Chloroflexota bacterium]